MRHTFDGDVNYTRLVGVVLIQLHSKVTYKIVLLENLYGVCCLQQNTVCQVVEVNLK